jgi:hypothetical protein
MEDLKKEVKKILDITKECPENLQQACFEILLRDFLESRKRDEGKSKELPASPPKQSKETTLEQKGAPETEVASGQGSDLTSSELHVKARKFMEKYNISIEQLNQLFYKEDENILPLFDDLKTTRTSESQIRVALLRALVNALSSGDFEANVEEIRSECQARKCYDTNNWGNNFQNNASLFDFGKYKKGLKSVRLSEAGKKELAELIEELQ